MDIRQTFILSDLTLKRVVDQIRDDQWDMQMPESFYTMNGQPVTLRETINYHAYDDAWIPDMLAGKTLAEAGADKFDGDLLGENPKLSFAEIADRAIQAARELDDLTRIVHFSYGDYPAGEALGHVTLFRGYRAHDLAEVVGVNRDLPKDLTQGLWEIVVPQAEMLRQIGVFQAEVEVPENAPLQDRLLGISGRQP